jgi:ATP-dependent DNA helicase RecG
MKYPEQESSLLEFKKEIPKNDQIIKTVIAFCNHKGGRLIVGVDNNGTIVGIDESRVQEMLEYVEKSIYDASHPAIIPLVYTQNIGDKILLIIEVFPGSTKPYFVKADGAARGVYVRLGRSTLRATQETIQELSWQASGRSLDQMPVYQASLQDFDEKKIHQFFVTKRVSTKALGKLETLLSDYHFATREQTRLYPTVAGMLLFGVHPQHFLPQAYTVCTHFSGTTLDHTQVLSTKDFTGTLIDQYNEAYDFVMSKMASSYVIKGPRRYDTIEIPQEAVREVIINAFAHRNYHLAAPIKIAIFKDRIEVFSPGSFAGPLTQHNLLMGLSFIRNDVICKVFKEIGIIEAFGIGFTTLFERYRARNLPTPEVIEGENFVKCILPRPDTTKKRAVLEVDLAQENILKLFNHATEITINDLMNTLNLARATAGRRLKELVDQKVLKKVGRGRTTRYVRIQKTV